MSPLGSMTRHGMPCSSASSSRSIPSPVLPEPVMPTMTPWVVRSPGSMRQRSIVVEPMTDEELVGIDVSHGSLGRHVR